MQGRLSDEDDVLRGVSCEQQREEVQASLSQAEDWLYYDGADQGASAYRSAPQGCSGLSALGRLQLL